MKKDQESAREIQKAKFQKLMQTRDNGLVSEWEDPSHRDHLGRSVRVYRLNTFRLNELDTPLVGELLKEKMNLPTVTIEPGVTYGPFYDAGDFGQYSDWLQIPETQDADLLTSLFAQVYEEWRMAPGIYQSEGLAKAIYELGSRGFQFELHLSGYFLPLELVERLGAKLIKLDPKDQDHETNTYGIKAQGRGFSDIKHQLFVGVNQHYLQLSLPLRRAGPIKAFLPPEIVSLQAISPERARG